VIFGLLVLEVEKWEFRRFISVYSPEPAEPKDFPGYWDDRKLWSGA